jgi:hypothetical protein
MKAFKRSGDIVKTYVQLEIDRKERIGLLWAFIRDTVGIEDARDWMDDVKSSIREQGADPKAFRDEANLALAMGPYADERAHPYAFTPQMQAAIGKVAEAAECDRDEAWDLICDTFPNDGGNFIEKNLQKVAKKPGPDAIDKALALIGENLNDERVVAFFRNLG